MGEKSQVRQSVIPLPTAFAGSVTHWAVASSSAPQATRWPRTHTPRAVNSRSFIGAPFLGVHSCALVGRRTDCVSDCVEPPEHAAHSLARSLAHWEPQAQQRTGKGARQTAAATPLLGDDNTTGGVCLGVSSSRSAHLTLLLEGPQRDPYPRTWMMGGHPSVVE